MPICTVMLAFLVETGYSQQFSRCPACLLMVSTLCIGKRMKEAWEMQKFLRLAEDELVWCREADTLLSNEDIGRDLQSVRFLLKIHQV